MTPSVARREPYQLVTPHPAPHQSTCVWYECYLVPVRSASGAEDRPNTQIVKDINCSPTTCIVCFDTKFLGQSIRLYVLWPINEIMLLIESLSVLVVSCWQRHMCLAVNCLKSSGNRVCCKLKKICIWLRARAHTRTHALRSRSFVSCDSHDNYRCFPSTKWTDCCVQWTWTMLFVKQEINFCTRVYFRRFVHVCNLGDEEVLHRIKEERNILHTTFTYIITHIKANWVGHISSRNSLLKHACRSNGRREEKARKDS